MTLKELIAQVDFKDVKKSLIKFYPDQYVNVVKYNAVYTNLHSMRPSELDIHWMIVIELTGSILHEHEKRWHVYGIMIDDPFKEKYNLEYIEWNKLLSYEVSKIQVQKLGEADYVAHCLYEMTFNGFDEYTIQRQNPKNNLEEDSEEEFNEDSADNVTDAVVDKIDPSYFLDLLLDDEEV